MNGDVASQQEVLKLVNIQNLSEETGSELMTAIVVTFGGVGIWPWLIGPNNGFEQDTFGHLQDR